MNDAQARQGDMLVRVDNFCAVEHAADFTKGTRGGDLAQLINTIVKALQAQAYAPRPPIQARSTALSLLRLHIVPEGCSYPLYIGYTIDNMRAKYSEP